MDEKRPPRCPGPRPFRDVAILCVVLRGSEDDKKRALDGQNFGQVELTLRRIAQRANDVAQNAPTVHKNMDVRVAILRNPSVKQNIDRAIQRISDDMGPTLSLFASDMMVCMRPNAQATTAASPAKQDDHGEKSAALLWTACALSSKSVHPSALIVPSQLTWKQLAKSDDRVGHEVCHGLDILLSQAVGLQELRSASWVQVDKKVHPHVFGVDDRGSGLSRQPPFSDPRPSLLGFRARSAIPLLKQSAVVDAAGETKGVSVSMSEFGDGAWPVRVPASRLSDAKIPEAKTPAHQIASLRELENETMREVARASHQAGIVLDERGGDFGLGPETIHIIVPVHTARCVGRVARWIATALDSQTVSRRIVAHPVLLMNEQISLPPPDAKHSESDSAQEKVQKEFEENLLDARASYSPQQAQNAVRVRGLMDRSILHGSSIESSKGPKDYTEPAHFAYARDIILNAEGSDYVMFLGTEFALPRAGWIEAIWRRREPGCGAAWLGRIYASKTQRSRAGNVCPRRIGAIADAVNTVSNLLQVQGRIMRGHTAFHTAAFRSGSVVDARAFSEDSELWDVLRSLHACVKKIDSAADALGAPDTMGGDAQKNSRSKRRKNREAPHPYPSQASAEARLAIADIALSYVFRPFGIDARDASRCKPARIPRVFAVPTIVGQPFLPKHAVDHLRAECLHITRHHYGNRRLGRRRPSTQMVWDAENDSFQILQSKDCSWSEYIRLVLPSRGEPLSYNIQDVLGTKITKDANECQNKDRTLIVYYEDATGCALPALRYGDEIPAQDRFVGIKYAAAYGGAVQGALIRSFLQIGAHEVEVRVLAPQQSSAQSARARLESEAKCKATFSCETVGSLSNASYFGSWFASARAVLSYIKNTPAHRRPTRVLMLRSIPLWGNPNAGVYMDRHVRSFSDVGVVDAGSMPFSGGVDFSVLGCRPWFLRAAVQWMESRPAMLERANRTPIAARRVFKEIVHDLFAPLALWPLRYTYPIWQTVAGSGPKDEAKVADTKRTLTHLAYVQRRGTNIIAPFFPSIRYRWRATHTSDRVRK